VANQRWIFAHINYWRRDRKHVVPCFAIYLPFDHDATLIVDGRQEQRHAICILGLSFKDAEEALQGAVWVSDNIAVTRIN